MKYNQKMIETGPADAPLTLALAHGAGAPMDSPFMDFFAQELGRRGLRVVRFEFPYMAQRREGGSKRPPNPQKALLACWRAVVDALGAEQLIIGGKSMGGRMASLLARELEDEGTPVRGVVCLGYPFHPPGKPEKTRTDHLRDIATPTLMVQGTRDTLGNVDDVAGYTLSPAVRIAWLEDGDHGFKPRKKSGRSEQQNWQEGIEAIASFVATR